jgi:CRISPR-associated protein Csh1
MLKAIRDLGEVLLKGEDSDEVDILMESYKLKNIKNVIMVVFRLNDGTCEFEKIYIKEYDSNKARRYLYRAFPHGHYDVTPTYITRLNEDFSRKTMDRWDLWFRTFHEKYDHPIIQSLRLEIQNRKEEISKRILEICTDLDKKEIKRILISISFLENGIEKHLNDIEIFKRIFIEESIEYFYFKHDTCSKGNGTCSLCMENAEVYGFASPFSVFTVDKVGFAYDFSRKNSWKQLPICKNCAIYLAFGKKFLEENLTFPLYGYRYYVIPRYLLGRIDNNLIEEIILSKGTSDHENLLGDCQRVLFEDNIVDILKEKEDMINLIFVFIEPEQKDFFKIVKYVEDVPPSWIRRASTVFCEINSRSIFREGRLKTVFGKGWSEDFLGGMYKGKRIPRMNLAGIIREFFPDNYVNIIGDILGVRPIEKNYLIRAFMENIRDKYINNEDWSLQLLALKSIYFLTFLIQLKLIGTTGKSKKTPNKEVLFMGTKEKKEEVEKVENFFMEFSEAFDSPDKKAVFLEGILTRKLLNVQFAKRNSTPFRSKLSGLKLNEKKVKKLLPEIMEKLTSYESFSYQWLEELVSRFYIEADQEGWKISDDEISYYFALGLNLGQILKEGGQNE